MKRVIRLVVGVMVPLLAAGPVSVAAQALSPQEIFRQVSPSVVVIEVWGEHSETDGSEIIASGSGVVIPSDRGDNVIVTNCHLTDKSGGPFFRVSGVGGIGGLGMNYERDAERDLCTITALMLDRKRTRKNEEPNHIKLPPVQIASSRELEVGDTVYAVGTPQGLEATLSNGIVSGFREHEGVEYIQTTAPISEGSSGGGLFNSRGQLVGITTMFIKEGQALNFAVPAELIALAPETNKNNQSATSRPKPRPQQPRDRWQLIAEAHDRGERRYVDTQTVRRVGEDVTVWTKATFDKPEVDKSGDTFDEVVILETYHCASRQRTTMSAIQRFRGDVVYRLDYKNYEMKRKDITPETVSEIMYETVCEL